MRHRAEPSVFFVILGSVFVAACAATCPGRMSGSDLTLHYQIEAVPEEGFRVELQVHGVEKGGLEFQLLEGWGVLQDQSSHIVDLQATDAEGREIEWTRHGDGDEAIWRVSGRPAGPLTLRYRVLPYDPNGSSEASFADSRRFVALGYSVFLLPEGVQHFGEETITVRVTAPPDWPVWTSWPGAGPSYFPPTAHDLWSGVVVGGELSPFSMQSESVSVTVLTEGEVHGTTGVTIANRLLPVLREMHRLFGAAPRGRELDVLALFRTLPRTRGMSIMTGNSEEGAFLCLATPDRYRDPDALTALATHECLHFYLGGAFTAGPEPPYRNAPELIWLMEGVTEYLTFRLMERAGVLTSAEMARVTTRKEREYRATQGWRQLTLADAARRMEESVYGLVYSRGFLVAQLLDEEMTRRCGDGTLEAVLRELFREHNFYRDHAPTEPETVRRVFDSHCPGIRELIFQYAEGNATLPPFDTQTASRDPIGR